MTTYFANKSVRYCKIIEAKKDVTSPSTVTKKGNHKKAPTRHWWIGA
jgi:hypothetical protein